MTCIAVSCPHEATFLAYAQALDSFDVQLRRLPTASGEFEAATMQGAQALLIGGGPDLVDGEGAGSGASAWMLELRHALEMDVPVLAIGAGMQLLNLAFGGRALVQLPGHAPEEEAGEAVRHQVYVAPGSKLSAILGPGGFFRANSRHHRGLREAQRAPSLLTSAYSLEDGVVEAVESPAHRWAIGVQFQPERKDETPRAFGNLFASFAYHAGLRQGGQAY